MRLLNTSRWEFKQVQDPRLEAYAIVSHLWGADEISFDQILDPSCHRGYGFSKISHARDIARANGFDWIWIDTCCIDKRSSAELSEAINSMFMWYQYSQHCYALLPDVRGSPNDRNEFFESFIESRWFRRGWTLQELLAPRFVRFFNSEFKQFGDKEILADEITQATGIHKDYLVQRRDIGDASIAERMSWAAGRETTKPEDAAYCLLGIFRVNMSLPYGEGIKAFLRLQLEILKQSDDESIFAWQQQDEEGDGDQVHGMLAPSANAFANSGFVRPVPVLDRRPHVFTSRGLEVHIQRPWFDNGVVPSPINLELSCRDFQHRSRGTTPTVVLRRSEKNGMWQRVLYECRRPNPTAWWWFPPSQHVPIYVPQPELDQARPTTSRHHHGMAMSQRRSMVQLVFRCVAVFATLFVSRFLRERAWRSKNPALEAAVDLCTWCIWMIVWRSAGKDTALVEMLGNGLLMLCACWRTSR